MKSDTTLQTDVQNALKWEPSLAGSEIGVNARNGVVTLTGLVDSYPQKQKAENTTKAIAGVKTVAETIDIRFGDSHDKTDTDIATALLSAFKWNYAVPNDKVIVKVERGWVTLEGNLNYNYQKEAAEDVASKIPGVTGVVNDIKVISETRDATEKVAIEQAFERSWATGDSEIHVKVLGSKVTLYGMVNSIYQKDEAGRIALNAQGVNSLDNQLFVGYDD